MTLGSHKTGSIVYNELRMVRNAKDCSFLLVEGADDACFWKSRRHERCDLVIAENRPNLLQALSLADAAQFGGALGVADADWDHLHGIPPCSRNLILTDCHDLECTLARTQAFRKVILELCDESSIAKFENSQGVPLQEALLGRCLEFGRMRWLNVRSAAPQPMTWMSISRFMDERTWLVKDAELHTEAVKNGLAPDVSSLRIGLQQLPQADPWDVVNGHDLVDILALAFRRVLSKARKRVLGGGDVASALRLAAERAHLQELKLFQEIADWESRNTPYKICAT